MERERSVAQAPASVQGPTLAVITICVDAEEMSQITGVIDGMSWTPVYEHLREYVPDPTRAFWSSELRNAAAGVAMVDLDSDPTAAISTIQGLQDAFTGKLWIIALSRDRDPGQILNAMRAGCSEYLDKPLENALLVDALSRFDRRTVSTAIQTRTPGKILSFFGAKGGVGTSTLAIHVALYLTRIHKKKTLLIDNHSELGHVCLYLGLQENSYHFHELIRNVGRLDAELLKGFVIQHSSGMDVLASPNTHGGIRNADADALEQTLRILQQEYDYIVLDCAPSFEETNLAVFDVSDLVYLIATPEIGAIRDLSRYVDGLLQSEQTTEKLRVVMNRCMSKEAMSTVQIEKAIRLPLSIKIQNSYGELVKAINTGEPVTPDKRSPFSSQIQQWTRDIVGDSAEQEVNVRKKGFAFWNK